MTNRLEKMYLDGDPVNCCGLCCYYLDRKHRERGFCMVNPPVIVGNSLEAMWPTVLMDHPPCGKFTFSSKRENEVQNSLKGKA